MSAPVTVPNVLGRARDVVAPALRQAIELLSPELRPVAAYHLGWSDAQGQPTGSDGGKGVRPALAVLSAEAVGASADGGVPGAVAVELVHNFSLIHDDVIDDDAERRHRPTVWALFGIGRAIIVGDGLLALAQQVVLDPALIMPGAVPLPGGPLAARALADATGRMIAGQALDMAFESEAVVSPERCLAMEAGKTGALLGCASSIGALMAGAPEATVRALDRFGLELGLAFQAVDDLLGIWGDPQATGKPTFSDLRQHKKTLPIAAALATRTAGAVALGALLERDGLAEHEVAEAAALVEECGGRAVAAEQAKLAMESALRALDEVPLVAQAKAELVELAEFVVERQF